MINQFCTSCISLILKQTIMFIITSELAYAQFQSQFWTNYQNQNFNELKRTPCSCCKFQFESCGIENILAIKQCSSTDYNQLVFESIQLKPHYQIVLTFNFWRIDEWNNDDFYVYLDYHKMYSRSFSHTTSISNICGNSNYKDEIFPITVTMPHTLPMITVIFIVKKGIWGINNMILEAKLCPESCQSCSENQCFDQYLYFFTLNWEDQVQSSDGWLTNNPILPSVILFLQSSYLQSYGNRFINYIKLNHHQAISLSVKVMAYNSNPTRIKIEIDDIIVSNIFYYNGWIPYPDGFGYRSIKIINIHQYPHINSEVKIAISIILTEKISSFDLFFAIRDFQLFLKSSLFEFICKDDDLVPFDGCFSNIFDCTEGCSNCIKGICLDCKTGWEYVELEQICIPICGDQLITHFEECDDGNSVPYDGCHLCRHSCPQNCKICQFGQCFECNINYFLSLNKKQCLSFCDENINAFYQNFDDQSQNQLDKNFRCQNYCELECKLCINNTCYQCNDGWYFSKNQCLQICGDGQIAINSIESCDDGNFNEGDGCFQCQNECIPNCFWCSNQNTCLICQEFFILVDNQCIPICGDGIVINNQEDCEDDNDLPYDGCYKCKFSCIQNCEVCQLGTCQQCFLGYQLIDNFCQKLNRVEDLDENDEFETFEFCGDGIIQKNESCDDFNQFNLDGCSSNCSIEHLWNCKNHINTSYCQPKTFYRLFHLNHTQSIEYVQLSFTNKLLFNNHIENFSNEITYKIDNFSQNQYELKIVQVSNIEDFNLLDLSFIFSIKFFYSIEYQPIFRVSFKNDLIDLNNNYVINNSQEIALQSPKILSELQLQTALNLKNLNYWILIALCICGLIMLILGDFQNFIDILDILQFQSNLKFINVPFPHNVEIYFESSNFISIKPFLQNLQILDLFNYVFDFHYCQSVGKFKYYDINADLLNNVYGLIMQIALILLIDMFLRYLKQPYYTSHNLLNYLNQISLSKSNIFKKIFMAIFTQTQIIIKKPFLINQIFITSLLLANSWDLLFKILLFIVSNKENTIRSFFSYIFSFGYLTFVTFFILQYFTGFNFKKILQNLRQKQYDAVILFKKFMFLMILIGIQNQQIIQCILLTVLLFSYLFFINIFELIYQKSELINVILQEVSVTIFTLLSLAYCTEIYRYLTADQYFLFGFIQIILLIIGLTGPLVKCFIKFYKKAQDYCLERDKILKKVQMDSTANPNILTQIKY